MTEKPLAFATLVRILEDRVRGGVTHELLSPFPCKSKNGYEVDIIAIQKAGRIIAQHAGLGDLIFIISVTDLEPTIAGHIELQHDQPDVYVTLSRSICDYPAAVLATLSHEVAHKFLHRYGIEFGSTQLEREYLTDVTAVYLGMGKLMLNGCCCLSESSVTVNRQTTTTTHTQQTGYISQECFAFVYRSICESRRVPAEVIVSGLSTLASTALTNIEYSYGEWFQNSYHDSTAVADTASKLTKMLHDCQDEAATQDQTIRKAQHDVHLLSKSIQRAHLPLSDAQSNISGLTASTLHRAAPLRYFDIAICRATVIGLIAQGRSQFFGLRPAVALMQHAVDKINTGRLNYQHEVIECPIDARKLRVPSARRRLLVTCPACKYEFIANTAHPDSERNEASHNSQPAPRKSLKEYFRIFKH